MEFDGQDAGVMFEIRVGGKDRPTSRTGNSANQSVHNGNSNALTLALIAGLSGELMIRSLDAYIGKSPKQSTKRLELRRISYA
jgi:hypothetical protein